MVYRKSGKLEGVEVGEFMAGGGTHVYMGWGL